jgi:ATP diphosphatase
LGTKAARVGFDWERPGDVVEKIHEELEELREALDSGDGAATRDELGDLLFSLAMLARHLDVDAEAALERSNLKFSRRFRWIEGELGRHGESLEETVPERLEQLWAQAKRRLIE